MIDPTLHHAAPANYTHQTTPTQFVEAAGIRFAYRRFANRRFGARIDIPLLFFMHFTGTMDHWDPALTDGFAQDREVILFNNAGVSSSGGEVPASIEEMARHAAAFIDALGVKKLDALGFSIGGLVAQQFALDRPDLVRKVILVGTGPRGGEGMASLTPEAQEIFGATYDPADELWLRVFFTPSERSQAAGRKYLERQRARKENRDPLPNEKVALAQLAALQKWGAASNDPNPYAYLKKITQPTLVVNGSNDVIVYTVNSIAESAERAAHSVPRQQSWRAVPIPGAVCRTRNAVPEGNMSEKQVKLPGLDHPISIERNPARVVVSVAGRVVADTRNAMTLREAAYPPVQYIPAEDVDFSQLERTDRVTWCPYKGDCNYYSVPAGGNKSVNAVWSYEDPFPAVGQIRGYVAFYPERVDAIEVLP